MPIFKKKKKTGKLKEEIPKRKRVKKEEFVSAFDDDDGEGQEDLQIGGGDGSNFQSVHTEIEEDPGDVNQWKKKKNTGGFYSFGLNPAIMKGIMKRGYKIPTPIQRKTIPLIMEGRDVVAMARTGSGKTAAFILPLLEKLMKSKQRIGQEIKYPLSLILSPTRELASQTVKFFRELGKFTNLKVVSILGGDSMESQFTALHDKPDVVVATPGRFMHLCVEMELKLDGVEYVVFDEADRLFEMGFGEQLTEILARLSSNRQTILFSATLPKLMVDFTTAGLHNPSLIRLDVDTKLPETLTLVHLSCRSEDKLPALLYLLKNEIYERDQTIVFVATKHHVEYLHSMLDFANISNSYIYSSLDPSARKINLGKFRNGVTNVLIVTDIAARGIDIPILDNVINFHFPSKPKIFMHRVGRAARAGRNGKAYSIISPNETAFLLDLHLFLGRPLLLEEGDSKKGDIVGRIPQDFLDEEHGFLRNANEMKSELLGLEKVCRNGFAQYLKSRPAASAESNRNAKDILVSSLPIHPVFGVLQKSNPMQTLITQMQGYRPRSTIFEIGPKAGDQTMKVMQEKRLKDQTLVEKYRTLKEGKASMKFSEIHKGKDEENFISYVPKDHHSEEGLSVGTTSFERQIKSSILDLTVDDGNLIKIQKSQLKWDRKRKKFVNPNSDDRDKKRRKIKTESGQWIQASYKSDRYNIWKEKSKIDSSRDADDDDEDNQTRNPTEFPGKPMAKTKGPASNPGKGQRFKSELKRPEVILKNRKQKELNEKKHKGKGKKNHRRKMESKSKMGGGLGSRGGGRMKGRKS